MHIRCPHGRNAVEPVADDPLTEIDCPSCGSRFALALDPSARIDDDPRLDATRSRASGDLGRIAHFTLIDSLGAGAFGTVYRASDAELDRTVAVKIPRKGQLDAAEAEQFLREDRAAAQLNHPNIVSVHEVGRDDGRLYIVSDLIDGVTLADRLTAGRPPARESAELCATLADALHHAHRRGVIHRDLKPGNVLLDAAGTPHVADSGLAKREAGEITVTLDGRVLGTPAYMAPEHARGDAHAADARAADARAADARAADARAADARGDVDSRGVIPFELLTGERPFRGNSRMLLHQVMHEDAPDPRRLDAAVPKDLATIALKCLEKPPERRYRSAAELAEELRRHLRGEPIRSRPIGRPELLLVAVLGEDRRRQFEVPFGGGHRGLLRLLHSEAAGAIPGRRRRLRAAGRWGTNPLDTRVSALGCHPMDDDADDPSVALLDQLGLEVVDETTAVGTVGGIPTKCVLLGHEPPAVMFHLRLDPAQRPGDLKLEDLETDRLMVSLDDRGVWVSVYDLTAWDDGELPTLLHDLAGRLDAAGLAPAAGCGRCGAAEAQPIYAEGKVARLCADCLEQAWRERSEAEEALNRPTRAAAFGVPAAAIQIAVGWAVFWTGLDYLLDWAGIGAFWLSTMLFLVYAAIAAGVGYVLGWPAGITFRRAPLVGRSPKLLTGLVALAACAAGEFLYVALWLLLTFGLFDLGVAAGLMGQMVATYSPFWICCKLAVLAATVGFCAASAAKRVSVPLSV